MMKHYKDQFNNIFAFESDGSQDGFIKPEMTPITDAELAVIRAPTPAQIAAQAEFASIQALRVETKANAAFDALKSADFVTINTFVNTHFATTDVQGRAMLKVMAAAAGAYLRENQ
jgi:hypothetical protein